MSLSDPLSTAQLQNLYHMVDCEFDIDWHQISDEDGNSEKLWMQRSQASWVATITSRDLYFSDAAKLAARIRSLQGGLNTCLLYDKTKPYPTKDPLGTLMGAAAPLLGVIADRLHAAFTGFPAGYQISAGDYVGGTYNSTQLWLSMFAEDVTASGGGAIASTQLAIPLPSSAVLGGSVTVYKSTAKFKIDPSSVRPALTSGTTKRISWTAYQSFEV